MTRSGSAFLRVTLVVALAATLGLSEATAQGAAADISTVDLAGLEARSAALLLSGQEAGDLEASFLATALATPTGDTAVLVVADLVGASLLEAATGPQLIVEVYAYVLDSAGGLRATLTRAFRLDLAARRAALERGGVKLLARVDLPGGATAGSVRLLVLHRASGRFALQTLPLAAAKPQTEPRLELSVPTAPLLVLERPERWLVARGGADELPPPLDKDHLLPATRLVATAGDSVPLWLTTGAGQPLPVTRLLDSTGQPLAELGPAGARARAGDLPPPDIALDLAAWEPGSYLLEMATADEPGRWLRLPLDLVAEQLADGAVWFDRAPAPEADPVPADTRSTPRGRSALQRLALSAYRRAFDAWLEDDLEAASAELRRFEAGAITAADEGGEGIEVAQRRAAAELAGLDLESLVPLMCLHERLFRFYYARESYLLATHSRRMALGLARLYAERGGADANRTAALVLVSLAGLRQEIGARIDALAVFQSALEMDPRQPEALLGLAALHESLAHYDTTVELLQRVDRAGPLSPAAGIRLAINLRRVGSTRQAEKRLRELVDTQPEWISQLAYQELARLLDDSQRAAEALSLLVEARQRYPDSQGLTIQQAALLDKLGKPLAGQRVLATVDALAGDRGESPRLRYAELPAEEIEAARRRLAGAAADRLAGAALNARAAREGAAP